jgi:hypothetical protein
LQKQVAGVSGGKITIRESISKTGRLECYHQDYLSRPVTATLPLNNYGVPVFRIPEQVTPIGKNSDDKEQRPAPK